MEMVLFKSFLTLSPIPYSCGLLLCYGGHRKIPWWSCCNMPWVFCGFPTVSSREHTCPSPGATWGKMFKEAHRSLFCPPSPVGHTLVCPPFQTLKSIWKAPSLPSFHFPPLPRGPKQLISAARSVPGAQNIPKSLQSQNVQKKNKNKTLEAPFCWLCTVFLLCCVHLYLPANYSQFSYLSSKRFPSKSTSRKTVCCLFLNLTVSLFLVLTSLASQARLTHSQALAKEG